MERPPEPAVRDALYNWLGYGNLDGTYWFVGREERFDIDECTNLGGWTDYFDARADFDAATDLRDTWEEAFGRPLSTFGTTTWNYEVAFLLALHGEPVSSDRVKRVLSGDPQFCRPLSDHFSGVFYPCPNATTDDFERYDHIWPSPDAYREAVAPGRLAAFASELEANREVELVVTYSTAFADGLSDRYETTVVDGWDDLARDPIILSALDVAPDRTVALLETPFLGSGRIGYDAIERVVADLDRHRRAIS